MEALFEQQRNIMNLISNFVSNTQKSGKDRFTQSFLQVRLDLLQKYWDRFYSTHNEIISAASSQDREHKYFKENHYDTVEMTYCDSCSYLMELLKKFRSLEAESSTSHQHVLNPSTSISTLPKIQLPRFSGDIKEWPGFHDLFRSLIDSNVDLSGSQKLFYLKTSLSGSAEQLLRNTAITDSNYATAWQILCTRYQNKRLLVTSYLKLLTSLPPMKSESPEELRKLFDGTSEAIKALQSLDRPVNQWDDWIVFTTVQKLDPVTRKDWENSCDCEQLPTFDELSKFLQHRVNTLEVVGASTTRFKEPTKLIPPKIHRPWPLKVNTITRAPERSKKCSQCFGKHLLLFCPDFRQKTVQQRRDLVSRERLCFNCLRPNHAVTNCPSAHRCKQCNQPHHSMLHMPGNERTSSAGVHGFSGPGPVPSSAPSQPDAKGSSALDSSSTFAMPPTPTTSNSVAVLNATSSFTRQPIAVLLATAQVFIMSPTGDKVKVRALLDQGSQATFVSSSIAKHLRLPCEKVTIAIQGVGSSSGVAKAATHLTIQSVTDPTFSLNAVALVLPRLTRVSVPSSVTAANFSHLHGLQLADPAFMNNAPIDLIIGADNYSLLLLDGLRKGKPMAQRTTLGWILSGSVNNETAPHNQSSSLHVHHTSIELPSDHLDSLLQRFWEVEDVPATTALLSEEDQACEDFYRATTRRDSTGRYVVRLPLRSTYQDA